MCCFPVMGAVIPPAATNRLHETSKEVVLESGKEGGMEGELWVSEVWSAHLSDGSVGRTGGVINVTGRNFGVRDGGALITGELVAPIRRVS